VLKHPNAATLEGLNEAWTAWTAWYNWHHSYKVPDQASPADRYIGRRVWTLLRGDRLTIECNREVIATHPVKTDYLDVVSRDN